MTTNHSTNPPLVVGIDGSDHGLRATDWAAATAVTRRWPIRLVNVFAPYVPLPAGPPARLAVVDPEGTSAAQLEVARAHLELYWPTIDVAVVPREGSTSTVLLDELDRGRMLVLGRRGMGRFAALLAGSTSLACAARARGTVVVVPMSYVAGSTTGRVVVGVDGSDRGESAIELAFAEASSRGGRLDVVHAWEQPSPYGFDFAGYGGPASWLNDQEIAVAEVAAGWQEKYPDVEVRTFVEEDHAAAALIRHAGGAELVVVGGRGHSTVANLLLGSITNAVLQHAPCPVAVVHETHQSR